MYNLYDFDDEEETYVIDSNDRILKRLEEYKYEIIEKKESEKQRRVEDFVNSLEYNEEGKPIIPVDDEGYYIVPMDDDGYPLVNIDEEGNLSLEPPPREGEDEFTEGIVDTEPILSNEEYEVAQAGILEEANRQAEEILEDARSQAEAIMSNAREEGRTQGYNDGMAEANSEYQQKYHELEQERAALLNDINAAKDSMESELVDVICDVVGKVFSVSFAESRDIILHLVDRILLNAGGSKTFIIRVNEANKNFLSENKESLLSRLGSDTILDIIADPLMEEGSCMIETDGGVFNCGIDAGLESLFRDLRLLSMDV